MIGVVGNVVSNALWAVIALLALIAAVFLMKDSLHELRLRRRQQRERERARREFWGYE